MRLASMQRRGAALKYTWRFELPSARGQPAWPWTTVVGVESSSSLRRFCPSTPNTNRIATSERLAT
jgi:hypothetical protein